MRLTVYTRVGEAVARHISGERNGACPRSAGLYSAIVLGIPLFFFFNIGFWARVDFSRRSDWPLIISVYIAAFWMLLAPMLITKWEQRYRVFVARIHALIVDDADRAKWEAIAHTWFATSVIFGLGFAFTASLLHQLARPYLQDVMPIPIWSGAYFNVLLVLFLASYATGAGIAGVLHCIRMYKALSDLHLRWEPFHQDQRGGFSCLTDFALATAATFSGGITVVPASLAMGAYIGGLGQVTMFVLVVSYGILVGLIFLWPMTIVFAIAQKNKRETLGHLAPVLDDAVGSILALSSMSMPDVTVGEVEALRVRISHIDKVVMLYEKIAAVKVTPFSVGSVVQVVGFSVLPLILAGAQLIINLYKIVLFK